MSADEYVLVAAAILSTAVLHFHAMSKPATLASYLIEAKPQPAHITFSIGGLCCVKVHILSTCS
ncbi:hypothetical protein BDZ91DRAFT_712200 [Kalaharituber pfeilii]|nr:hypothetical protein BDZ91DRAFT_712200 [Kalaharituber pfeilii]